MLLFNQISLLNSIFLAGVTTCFAQYPDVDQRSSVFIHPAMICSLNSTYNSVLET